MSKQRGSSSKTSRRIVNAVKSETPSPARDAERIPSSPSTVTPDKTTVALRLLFFCFFLFFWGVRYRDFLYVAQEYDLFLWDWGYLREGAERVAGLSRYLSSFLVQFFYFPFVGALIVSGCLSLIQYGTEKLFHLSRGRIFWSFIPPCLITLQTTCVNYFLFESMDVAYIFSPIFNCAFAMAFALVYNSLRTLRGRVAFLGVGLALAYPVFGFWALLSGFFCVLRETELSQGAFVDREKTGKRAFVDVKSTSELCEFLFLYVLLVPGAYWFCFAETTTNFRYMYLAGLGEESVTTEGREFSTVVLWTLYQTTTLLSLFFYAVAGALRGKIKIFGKKERKERSTNGRFAGYASVVPILLCVLACAATCRFSYSSSNFRTLLKTARLLESRDWNAILRAESKVAIPINPLIVARMTALTRTDQIAEQLFARPLVPKISLQLETVGTFGMCGDRLLYELGAVNLAFRTATNNYVVKRARSVWALKTLTLCALADRRTPLAERYLYRLQRTLFHRRFADEALACLRKNDAPALFGTYLTPPTNADVRRAETLEAAIETTRRLEPLEDDLGSSETVNEAYYRQIQLDDLSKREPNDRENRLATLLVMRNLPRFGEFFDAYLQEKGDAPLPRALQEAALFRERFPKLFEKPENRKNATEIPPVKNVDQETRERFDRFLATLNSPGDDAAIDAKLRREFGDTFWYFAGSKQVMMFY